MVLLVHPNGSEYWQLRYCFGCKENMLALGKYPTSSLADARARRDEARKLLANSEAPGKKEGRKGRAGARGYIDVFSPYK